jgi:hypothetical protein
MSEKKQPVRGLRSVRLSEFGSELTYADIMALEELGTIKDEGISANAGSETEEKWIDSMGNVKDSFSEKEKDTYEGALLIDDLKAFADQTGGEAEEVTEDGKKYVKYTGPNGSNNLKKGVYIETDTEPVPGEPIIWGWRKASIRISPEINFSRKKWHEAKFKITPLSPDVSYKPAGV